MSRTNYAGKYKNQAEESEIIETETVENEVSETEPVEETLEVSNDEPKYVNGIIINCKKLNVRSNSSIDSKILCTIDLGSTVEIDMSKSTTEWYSVCTEAEIEGFCMSNYILIL